MKKFLGWLIIIITGLLLLSFAITIFIVADSALNKSNQPIAPKDLLVMCLSYLIMIGLLILGLLQGVKMVRNPKVWTPTSPGENISISFTSTISLKEYRSMIFENAFKKRFLIIIASILLMMVLGMSTTDEKGWDSMKFYALGLIIAFSVLPILLFIQAKKLYQSNKALHEKITYSLNNEKITIQGESFNAECNWNHFLKTKESKGFFMIFEGQTTAIIINKAVLNEEQTIKLRELLKSKLPS